jgi:hypothetical protein
MLRKLHYRRLQIDQAKLTINIAMFRAILQCILQENTRFDLASSAGISPEESGGENFSKTHSQAQTQREACGGS